MILPQELVDLIMKYVRELWELEELIKHFQRIYYPFVDVILEDLADVVRFISVLESKLPDVNFVRFTGGCSECKQFIDGVWARWTYVDLEPLSVRAVMEFASHLKCKGTLCPHERLDSILCIEDIAYIQLKNVE